MTDEQRLALGELNFSLIIKTTDDITALLDLLQNELDKRNAIASKEKAIALAKKVQNASGKDQNIPALESELYQLRKEYAIWSSATPLYPSSPDRLQPLSMPKIVPKPMYDDRPVWQMTSILDDGTEQHLGYSYGEPELPEFEPTENEK